MLAPLRTSFAAKILAALLGTVGVLLLVTITVVRSVTTQEISRASEAAILNASQLFRELEEIQRQQVERVAVNLTQGRRTEAALEEALTNQDIDYLGGQAGYELDGARLTSALLAFTDVEGQPLVSLLDGRTLAGDDPLGVGDLARALLASEDYERRAFVVVDGRLYAVTASVIEIGVVLGSLVLGLPMSDEEIERIGGMVGVDVCFVVGGACVAGTSAARFALADRLVAAVGEEGEVRATAVGTQWSIRAQPLVPEEPTLGARVIAYPLEQVTAPFRRITRALALGGLGALGLAAVIAVVLAGGLTRPVRALVAATGEVAKGHYDAEVEVGTRDEIGALAEAFNEMTSGLRLKEQYRSVLNKVVSEDVARELMEGGVELGGETRHVTVLFADIRGFTALTEGMEPQAVIGLLNECMQRLSDAVEAEGGVVDKYVGDELMAVFGAPISAGEDARRAVQAALRMRAAMADLNEERARRGDAPLGLGVGINTGEAVAGNMGSANRLNYTVLGSSVNLGARLCSGAAPGEVLVTRAVFDEAGLDPVEATSLGGRAFKGFSDDVEVLSLV